MKLTRRIKIKVADGIGKLRWVPVGYYKNRPGLLIRNLHLGMIGTVDNFRMITSACPYCGERSEHSLRRCFDEDIDPATFTPPPFPPSP